MYVCMLDTLVTMVRLVLVRSRKHQRTFLLHVRFACRGVAPGIRPVRVSCRHTAGRCSTPKRYSIVPYSRLTRTSFPSLPFRSLPLSCRVVALLNRPPARRQRRKRRTEKPEETERGKGRGQGEAKAKARGKGKGKGRGEGGSPAAGRAATKTCRTRTATTATGAGRATIAPCGPGRGAPGGTEATKARATCTAATPIAPSGLGR